MTSIISAAPVTVVVIETDGQARREEWTPDQGGGLLRPLQQAIGGLIDVVAIPGSMRLDMWVHDSGLYECDPNPVATAVAMAYGRIAQPYFGPAVLTGSGEADGVTRGLTEPVAACLLRFAGAVRRDSTVMATITAASVRFANAYW